MKIRVRHGLMIDREPSDVFAYVSDPDKMPEWQSGLFDVGEKQDAPRGKLASHARVKDRRNLWGKELDTTYEVVEFEQDRRLTLQLVNGDVSWRCEWTFESFEDGTWFTADGRGDLGRLPAPGKAVSKAAQRMLEADLTTLRDILEA